VRRWNGWGDDSVIYPFPDSAAAHLSQIVGEGDPVPDATFEDVIATVPSSRLPDHPLVTAEPADRLFHARGQSLPDWIALRSGRVGPFPDGVVYANTTEDVRTILKFVLECGSKLIPYGGGTSVVGHINTQPCARPTLTLDLSRLNMLLTFDEIDQLATFQAGVLRIFYFGWMDSYSL
jgi:alkyldihydroxyacetonephosphate synthase